MTYLEQFQQVQNIPSGTVLFRAQISRDLTLALRGGGGWFHTLFFFMVFVGLSGFAIGPERSALREAAPALIWLGTLLAIQFSTLDLFRPDMEDGTLQVLAAEQPSLLPFVGARLVSAMITLALPLALLVPLAFVLFSVEMELAVRAGLLLILASPALILACVVAAALSAGARTGGLLGVGLAAPLVIPVLIFGIGATQRLMETRADGAVTPEVLLLGALTLFYAVILPPFAILAIRLGLE